MPTRFSSLPSPCQRALPATSSQPTHGSSFLNFAAPFKVTFRRHISRDYLFAALRRSVHLSRQPEDINHSLCTLIALGVCTVNVILLVQSASAVDFHLWADRAPASSYWQRFNEHLVEEKYTIAANSLLKIVEAEESVGSLTGNLSVLESSLASSDTSDVSAMASNVPSTDSIQISSLQSKQLNSFLDYAKVFSPAKSAALLNDINSLEAKSGWRLRVITKSGLAKGMSSKDLKDLWRPDEKTVIVIEDISSPNILNFNAGTDVVAKLPRQFFIELQSRYGNQFFVKQEGEEEALSSTVRAIQDCLQRPEGCRNVPGLTNDLYYLTLATSIAGGCIFGFAARLPPSGRVEASWQWVAFLAPLWLLLFVSFGILPVIGRTSELEPLIKNAGGFAVGAFALYLTPIFGPSPISKK